MALAGEMLLNADGLVVNAFQDAEGRGAYFPGSAGTSEGQFLFIIGNLHAYKATGNPLAKEAAELALKNLLRVVYRNMPVPDAVDRTHIFAPHWLFNVKYPFSSAIIHYDRVVNFSGGVGVISQEQEGDKVRYVFGARSLNSKLLWDNPYSPVTQGQAYTVASNAPAPGGTTTVRLSTAFTGSLFVTYSTQTGPNIEVNEPFEAWPDWRKLEPGEIACAVDVFVWAYRAFTLAAEVLNNPTWALAAQATRQQAAIAFDINDSRDWVKPTWAKSPFASGSRFSYSTRIPAPNFSVDANGSVVILTQAYGSGGQEVQYGNASVKDTYGANDVTTVEIGSSEPLTVELYIDQYQAYAPENRYIAQVALAGAGLETIQLTRANFKNSLGATLPAASPVYTFGVSTRVLTTHSVSLGRVRQSPPRVVPYYPGAIPFTANFQGLPAQLIDWRGPVYMGYQSPYMWRVVGNDTAARTDVQLLHDSQAQWKIQTGQPRTGPFAPVFIFDRDDAVQYGQANTFTWEGPDPNTKWGGYQYRPLPELVEAAVGLPANNALRIAAVEVAGNFLDWLASDWPWLPMWAPWSNKFAEAIEMSLALAWFPMPVVPFAADAFAAAINKASAHGYTAADTEVPMLPLWNRYLYPFLPELNFPKRPPLGPPTDFPKAAPEINYPEPHMAALIFRAVMMLDKLQRPNGNADGEMRVQHRALVHKCMALLEALWQTEGIMAGTFSHNPADHEWYGFWHGEILDTLSLAVEWAERANAPRPSIAAQARIWIDGMLRWAKTNTEQSVSPLGEYPWKHRHNWRYSVSESFEFATAMYTSFSGKEQRSSQRIEPRRSMTLRHTLTSTEASQFEAVLRLRQNKAFLLPQWHLARKTTAPAPAGQSFLLVEGPEMTNLRWGTPFTLSYGTTVLVLTVRSTAPGRINLDQALVAEVPSNASVMPMCNALIDQDTSSTRFTGTVLEAQTSFRILPQEDLRKLPVLPPEMLFPVGADNREIVLRKPNWITTPTVGHSWEFNVSQYVNGPVTPINGRDMGARQIQARWTLYSVDEVNKHLGLLARLHGRRYACWLPSWTDDFELTRPFTTGRTLYVKPNPFAELGLLADPSVGIFIRLRDGRSLAARVQSVVQGSLEFVLVLDRDLTTAFTLDDIEMVSVLYRVRQVSDTNALEWLTDSKAQTTAAFVTVFDET